MDDDIDIEEHDVMDNPRIKSIFPDLSCVKIEIPDEEDTVEEPCDTEPTDEPQEMLYQYEYSFETTIDDIQTQDENEDYEDDNNTYFYNNEIILGTKPTTDPVELYEEALNSHPIVYLENWDDRLISSPCFCITCQILFPTVNALDAHKMTSHSYLVAMATPQKNTARKSTVTSKFCNHCSKMFPDDTSLIKHLYELLPLNNFPKVKEEKPEPEMVKGKMFPQPGPWPKKIKTTSHVISKVEPSEPSPKKIKIEKTETVETVNKEVKYRLTTPRDGKFFVSSLVPKSTLFQCNVCQIGFLSCFSASQHAKCCRKILTFNKCGICKRKIRTKDVKTHELQHSYNDKLKIYTMTKSLYDRLLCKCPKCLTCFDELAFWAHYQKCKKSDKKCIRCPDCDINISPFRYKRHRLKHSQKKLTKKDFIVLEFYDQNNMKAIGENRADMIKMQKRAKQKIYRERHKNKVILNESKGKGVNLYYCELCGCCQYILNYKGHTDGSCRAITSKKYCEKCGLCFTLKSMESHLVLHEKRSFSLKDINIYNLTTGKLIETPMSKFYECGTCSKNFLYRRALNVHKCKTEKYVTCKVCSKKFNLQAYKIHKIFHSMDKLIPELMKKYNQINDMWNVMYMCGSCELVTMTYDAAVTHSQGHLNYVISDWHKQCVVCDLRIAEKEFVLHEKLHSNNDSIGRGSFKILKYNHEDLFKKQWLMMFEDLPKEHRQRILSTSIYRFTRSVKMHIEVNARSDDVKYFCMNCNTFVDGTHIRQHLRAKCSRNTKHVCDICHEVFKTLKQFLSHEGSHETSPKRHTIITFNNECDREFNNHLSLVESKDRKSAKDIPLSRLRELLLSDSVRASHNLYKCAKCEICVTLKSSVRRHRCVWGKKRRFCAICEQYFCAEKAPLHLEAHRKKPSITKNSFHLVYFNGDAKIEKGALKTVVTPKKLAKNAVTAAVTPKKESIANITPKKEHVGKVSPKKESTVVKVSPKKLVIANIFKCQCGLHFTSMKTVEKHLDECNPDYEVSKETCSKCKLLFPTEVLVTHLINHHHKETKILIENIAKNELYKCSKCSVYFTTMDNYTSHIVSCDTKNGIGCENCGFSFGKKCFSKHLCSSEDVTYINKITVMKKKTVKEATVYKCVTCNICYLQRNSFKYHSVEVNHMLKKPPSECDFCHLKFTNCSLRKHENVHSFAGEDYCIKVVDPFSGGYEFIRGSNQRVEKDTDNDGSRRLSRRKRKLTDYEFEEMETDLVKKEKVSRRLSDIDAPLSERKGVKKPIDKASTSRESIIDIDDTPSEIIVPDEISTHDASDIDTDTSEMNTTLDKNGLSSKIKSRMMVKRYSKHLYRCVYCNQHYMKEPSFDYHAKTNKRHDTSENVKCDICDLEFSRYTLPRHKYVHHDYMKLKKGDFIIITETAYTKEIGFEHRKQAKSDSGDIHDETDIKPSNVNDNGDTHDSTVNENDSANDTCDNNSDITDNVSDSEKIYYYKCSDCNVCFVDQKLCFEHTLKHETLNAKTYIQCKICDFQFLIDSLKVHMDLHHSIDFRIENLTIYEYKALGIGLDPKVDVYQAVDKVQSRLVSTTSDLEVA